MVQAFLHKFGWQMQQAEMQLELQPVGKKQKRKGGWWSQTSGIGPKQKGFQMNPNVWARQFTTKPVTDRPSQESKYCMFKHPTQSLKLVQEEVHEFKPYLRHNK